MPHPWPSLCHILSRSAEKCGCFQGTKNWQIQLHILDKTTPELLFVENPSGRHWWCCAYWHWRGVGDNTVWWSWITARWCGKFLCKILVIVEIFIWFSLLEMVSLSVSYCSIHFDVFYLQPHLKPVISTIVVTFWLVTFWLLILTTCLTWLL